MTQPEIAHASSVNGDLSRPPPLVSVQDLRIHFRGKRGTVHAVDGVTLDIADGETLGLVGETGSGKSVSARSLLRLVPVPPGIYAGGRVLFRPKMTCPRCQGTGCEGCENVGRIATSCPGCSGAGCGACEQSGRETLDLLRIPERRLRHIRGNRIAMIFQDPGKALNPALSVRRQLAEVFAEHRADELLRDAGLDGSAAAGNLMMRRDAQMHTTFWERRLLDVPPLRSSHRRLRRVLDEHIAEALADTRIPNPRKVMNSYPHQLSGGMKQRVMIAQALACDPDLLIADEPTTALDVTIQARILDLIAELQERHGTTVLYISHDLSLVRHISDRVAVLYAGKLAEVGPTERIFDEPLHPYTRGLLAASPAHGQRRGELSAIEGTVPELISPGPACRFHTRCPHAAPVCARVEPGLNVQRPDQRAACFLYDSAEQVGAQPDEMPTEAVAR
ncbi:MAG: ATP-binding cassette domain-containing protein [Nitriliruptorales bacterium]|nr:ATP-binding cassette domain-containing protein [Nitriliruptorales bacterium]